MRPRTRLAVSVLVVQIGSITRMTNDVSISCTGKGADHRVDVLVERAGPCLRRLGRPARAVSVDILGAGLRERHSARRIEVSCRALALLEGDRVVARHKDRTGLGGALSRLG